MPIKVLKTIVTPSQRIPAGTELPDDAVLDGPLNQADWQRTGHLEAPAKAEPPIRTMRAAPSPAADSADA